MKRILVSRPVTILCLLLATLWDAVSTYSIVGKRLWLDGNPFIRTLTWTQVILLQAILLTLSISAFLFVFQRQRVIWPDQEMGLTRFVLYRLKTCFSLDLSSRHFRTEDVYAGMLLIWVLIFAHTLAGIINTLQLLLERSLSEVLGLIRSCDVRMFQNISTVFIIILAVILAHLPLYLSYSLSQPKEGHGSWDKDQGKTL